MYELIRIHRDHYREDKFSQLISGYPDWEDTLTRTVKGLRSRKDYEFFLARVYPSNEIVGWIAISFVTEGNETRGRNKFEAKLEWTEMYSNILKTWKVESSGKKSSVWEEIRRASSSLQAIHMLPDHCIINALVLYPDFEGWGVAESLLEQVIHYWRNKVEAGTAWTIWVQAPAFAQSIYKNYAFDEVGEYNVELGDHGFSPKSKRSVSGKYGWKFMVRRDPSGSASDEPLIANLDKYKSKEQRLEEVEESVPERRLDKGKAKEQEPKEGEMDGEARKLNKGKGKKQDLDDLQPDKESQPRHEDLSEYHPEPKCAWEGAEIRLNEIQTMQGPPPFPGEVAILLRNQRRAETRGYSPTRQSKGKDRKKGVEIAGSALRGEPPARPLQSNTNVTSQAQDNFVPTKSEEDLIEAMRAEGVDEEEIELVKALTFSLSYEVEGE